MRKLSTETETVLWEALGGRFDDFREYREELRTKGRYFFEPKHLFKSDKE